MTIRNILVTLELMSPSTDAMTCALALADRFGATVSAFAAARPWAAPTFAASWTAVPTLADQQRKDIGEAVDAAEARFHASIPQSMQGRYFGIIDAPGPHLVEAALTTDLILAQTAAHGQHNPALHADMGQLVLASGRPVLLLAENTRELVFNHMLVAWKDSREARRAVSDALPLLKLAAHVDVVSVDEGDYGREREDLQAAVEWFGKHKISSTHDVLPIRGTVAETIAAHATRTHCDLIVAGGYGHARLREWLFGGVTNELLDASALNRFLSN